MNVVGFPRRVRTLWISGIHLGTRGCRADDLLAFLHTIECRTLYLVGDFVDCGRLKKSWYWPASRQAVIRELLRRADAGVEVIFIPGNHDGAAREFDGLDMAGIKIHKLCRLPYWSLSAFLKHRVKNAVQFIADWQRRNG